MEHKMKRTLTGIAAAALLLSACGDMNLKKYNPFGGDPVQERSRTPANATEYQCAGGKRIYVRTLDGGQAVWLILADPDQRLPDRLAAAQRRQPRRLRGRYRRGGDRRPARRRAAHPV